MIRIGVVGASYRHASSEQVARFAIPKAELSARLPVLRAAVQGGEVLYLGTCNRVEVAFVLPDGPAAADLRPQVFRALLGREPSGGEATGALRAWTGEAAIEHLFLVACGLDSAQAGEQEIYVQLRAAWQTAREAHATGPLLDRIVSEALAMARHAHRLQTHHAPSLADRAAEWARTRAGGARDAYIALVGVSPMTRRCGARLAEHDVPLLVVNRSIDAAEKLAGELSQRAARTRVASGLLAAAGSAASSEGAAGSSTRAMSLDAFRSDPPHGCAALVCATGASEPVLDGAALERLAAAAHRAGTARRAGQASAAHANGASVLHPLIVDLGLPPNIDPEAARACGLERIGMDDLVRTVREERVTHLMRLAPIRAAIDERLARLRSELAARAIGPRLARLREDFERITAAEVERLLSDELADLDAPRRERLAEWATALAHRLAHLPLSGLRAAAEHASTEATDAFFREARLRRTPPPA